MSGDIISNYLTSTAYTLQGENPPEQFLGIIELNGSESKLQIRQEFKRVTGRTAIEDMFIELPQAEERQEVKDKIRLTYGWNRCT